LLPLLLCLFMTMTVFSRLSVGADGQHQLTSSLLSFYFQVSVVKSRQTVRKSKRALKWICFSLRYICVLLIVSLQHQTNLFHFSFTVSVLPWARKFRPADLKWETQLGRQVFLSKVCSRGLISREKYRVLVFFEDMLSPSHLLFLSSSTPTPSIILYLCFYIDFRAFSFIDLNQTRVWWLTHLALFSSFEIERHFSWLKFSGVVCRTWCFPPSSWCLLPFNVLWSLIFQRISRSYCTRPFNKSCVCTVLSLRGTGVNLFSNMN